MPHALIVDNDAENSTLLSEVFRECGYSPETAQSLTQARDVLLHHAPEIAILNEHVDGDDTLGLLESIEGEDDNGAALAGVAGVGERGCVVRRQDGAGAQRAVRHVERKDSRLSRS